MKTRGTTLPLFLLGFMICSLFILRYLPNEKDPAPLPNDWFFSQRAYPAGKINHQVYLQSLMQAKAMKQAELDDKVWELAGPENVCGRLSDVESHPDIDQIYLGTASGGIFRINDDGTDPVAIFDEALSLSIGDIAIAPSNADILYVGTGEANGGGGSQTYDGVGVYKSVDGGDSWEHMGLENSRNVGRVAVHPQDPHIVFVAAMGNLFADSPDRGIYRSIDGGESWEQVLFLSDSTGGIDLVINPDSPDIIYAAMWERIRRPDRRNYGGPTCGIFRSDDGGDTWAELTDGLPATSDEVGRIGIDICQSDPDVLYAIYADDIGYFKNVYKTDDGGDSWTETNGSSLTNVYQSYGWWFGRIKVDPIDPETAYIIGFDVWKTSNAGNSWYNISEYEAHVDQHEIYIDPNDNDRVFLGNDGGFYISEDGGSNWDWIDNLPNTQFYTCEIDEQYPQRLYGGTQDNGTNRTMTGNIDDWNRIYGGDGFYVLVDPLDNDYIYAEYQYGGLGRSTNGGYDFNGATNGIGSNDRKNWMCPLVFDPTNPETLFFGTNKVYKSTNRAASWIAISYDLTDGPGVNLVYGTVTTLSVSPLNTDIIYAGTDDGNVWVTENGGASWTQIDEVLPDRWVTRLAADPLEENTVYVTFSGYRWDEYLPHVFISEDLGANWTDISSNLPEVPLNDIIIDPENTNTLYTASDVGVFVSYDQGGSWEVMGVNLPTVPVNDLDLHQETRKLIAATFGRSMYSYDLNQDTVSTRISTSALAGIGEMLIFPNPIVSSSTLQIDVIKKEKVEIYLVDLSGRMVGQKLNKELRQGRNQISLSAIGIQHLTAGTYTLVIRDGARANTKKVIWGG